MDAPTLIRLLQLLPHPEGGYYRETYRSESSIDVNGKKRNYCTGIYFLLEKDNFSALHRIKSDELWHFYAGDPLEIIEINPSGNLTITTLGEKDQVNFQYCVKAGNWFGSRVKSGGPAVAGSLVGCTVSPGFDFEDFEMASAQKLISEFPQHSQIIKSLTRF
jgi:predicted cupin superfamily sugar epimerase